MVATNSFSPLNPTFLNRSKDIELGRHALPPTQEVALEKCMPVCKTRDLDRFKSQVQESLKHLRPNDMKRLFSRTTLDDPWVDGTRYLLEQGASPSTISLAILAQKSTVPILELLAEFERVYKADNERYNALPRVR